jgi:hypothetical protein
MHLPPEEEKVTLFTKIIIQIPGALKLNPDIQPDYPGYLMR